MMQYQLLRALETEILLTYPLFHLVCRHPDVLEVAHFNPKSWVVVVRNQPNDLKCPYLENAVAMLEDQVNSLVREGCNPWSIRVLTCREALQIVDLEKYL